MRKMQQDFQKPSTNFTQCLKSADLNETPKVCSKYLLYFYKLLFI